MTTVINALLFDGPSWQLIEQCNFFNDTLEIDRLFQQPRPTPSLWPPKEKASDIWRLNNPGLTVGNHPWSGSVIRSNNGYTNDSSSEDVAVSVGVVGTRPPNSWRDKVRSSKLSLNAPEFVPKSIAPSVSPRPENKFTPLPTRPSWPASRSTTHHQSGRSQRGGRKGFRGTPLPPSSLLVKLASDGFVTSSSDESIMGSQTRSKEVLMQDEGCLYCSRRGYDVDMVSSHCLRHPITQAIICPNLKGRLCPRCGDQGRHSHTERECLNR